MESKERVRAALHRRPVDRVPILEMAIDWAVMRGLGYRRYLEMVRELDLDGVPVNQTLYLLGLRRQIPDRALVMTTRNDFSASWFLCGMDRLLMSYIDEPELAEELGRVVSNYYAELIHLAVRAGVDVVFLTDDYAFKSGTLMSREHFRRFVLPWLRNGVEAVHAAGGLCVKHTDGDVHGIIDLLVETGIDGIGPLAPAGGHILSSGNTITSSVSPENYKAMIRAAR